MTSRRRCGPGVRQNELSAIFLRGVFEQGASSSIIDPIWSITPLSVARARYTANGDVGFPLASNDRFLREGDLILCDTGHHVDGVPLRLRQDLDLQRRPEADGGAARVLSALVRGDRGGVRDDQARRDVRRPRARCGGRRAEARAEALLPRATAAGATAARPRSSAPTWDSRSTTRSSWHPGWCSCSSRSCGATASAATAARRSSWSPTAGSTR